MPLEQLSPHALHEQAARHALAVLGEVVLAQDADLAQTKPGEGVYAAIHVEYDGATAGRSGASTIPTIAARAVSVRGAGSL